MGRRKTEFFIASRIASSKGGSGGRVMQRIAVATSAVSTAVMIIAVAVIAGFRSEITSKLCAFTAHVRVLGADSGNSLESVPIRRDAEMEKAVSRIENFRDISAFAVKGGIIKTDDAMQGVLLKGVDENYDRSFFERNMVEGSFPEINDSVRHKQILLSQSMASMLALSVGDVVQMMFLQDGHSVRRDRFRVSGIYSSGLEEMDRMTAITEIASVRRLCGWDEDMITGYEINTTDFGKLEQFADRVADVVSDYADPDRPLSVEDAVSSYPNLFDWLRAHNVNAAVIITVMIVVALFNMISALLIILLERTRMIGVLKALGMPNGAVQRVFVIRSAYLLALGILIGDAAGIALALLQKYTHAVKLDQSGYFLSWVPIDLNPLSVVLLDVGAAAVILALLAVPVTIISKIKPDKTLRYQ